MPSPNASTGALNDDTDQHPGERTEGREVRNASVTAPDISLLERQVGKPVLSGESFLAQCLGNPDCCQRSQSRGVERAPYCCAGGVQRYSRDRAILAHRIDE